MKIDLTRMGCCELMLASRVCKAVFISDGLENRHCRIFTSHRSAWAEEGQAWSFVYIPHPQILDRDYLQDRLSLASRLISAGAPGLEELIFYCCSADKVDRERNHLISEFDAPIALPMTLDEIYSRSRARNCCRGRVSWFSAGFPDYKKINAGMILERECLHFARALQAL